VPEEKRKDSPVADTRIAVKLERTDKCVPTCSFNPQVLGEEDATRVHALFEAFPTETAFMAAVASAGIRAFSRPSYYRHRKKHLRPLVEAGGPPEVDGLSHLDLLQLLIKQGAKSVHTMKLTPQNLMEAMKLYYQLTKGSAFADFEEALAMGEDDESDSGESVDESGDEPG
jgi:hypothetical protein